MRIPEPRRSAEDRRRRSLLVQALSRTPPAQDARFPHVIRDILENVDDPETDLHAIVETPGLPRQVRFAALYALLLRLRREERHGEYAAVVRRYEDQFGTEPYFHTFRAISTRMRGDLASLRSSVEFSRQAVDLMPDVPAVVHQLAAFWVEYLERLDKGAPTQDLDQVERHVDRAIALSQGKLAHYFETKGRVLALRGEFEAARVSLAQAIELEPRTSRDYLRRLTQYQATRVRVDLLEERSRWFQAQDRLRKELTEFKTQQLQLLGLLAAVVAFVATAGNVASQSKGADGIRLMLVAAGAIGLVFGTFSLINNSSVWRVGVVATLASGLIATGMFVPDSWMP